MIIRREEDPFFDKFCFPDFQNLKEVMLEVLRQALGKQYTPEVAEAWNKTLDMMFAKIYQVFAS